MTKELNKLILEKKQKGHVFRNLIFMLFLAIIILFDAFVFSEYSTWSAPVIIFVLELFIIEILAKILDISEAPVIIRILLYFIKDKQLD